MACLTPFPYVVRYSQMIVSHPIFSRIFCSEKSELIFKNPFLTILFPIDRFAEMGPSSRTFFSHNGFRCLQVLDHIHAFYQVKYFILLEMCMLYYLLSLTIWFVSIKLFVMIGEHVKGRNRSCNS